MTEKAQVSKKFLWVIVAIAIVAVVLLAVFLEQLTAASPITEPLPAPQFSEPSGVYDHDFVLTLDAPSVPNAEIIYTTNGRSPLPEYAIPYTAPIPLNTTNPQVTVIRARTLLPDGTMSAETIATYAMGIETDLPLMSLVTDPDNLWSAEQGIFTNRTRRGAEWERPAHITYLDKNGRLGFSENVGIKLHGQGSSVTEKKSVRLYFRQKYGLGRLTYPLYPESDVTTFDRLVLHSGGQDNPLYSANWTLMRTQLMAKLAREIDAHTTYNQPVLTFINGELYGIYYLRERLNVDYFQDHYDIDNVQILNSPHRDQDQPEAVEDWWELEAYAAENNMADPEHYDYVLSQIDVNNMIDHYILQMYAANSDWPYNNDVLFRGDDPLARWRWILWDVDYSFGMLPASNLNFDMVTWMMDPQSSRVRAATRFFRSLWDNPDFRNRFLVRASDLFNTTLSPEHVSEQLTEVESALTNDIGYEISRWGSSGNWYASVAEMQTFAEQRSDILRQQFVEGFDLAGTAVLTLNPSTTGKGSVILNHALTPELPYIGDYFLDTTITLTAMPEVGYQFTGWQVNGEMVDEETAVLHHTLTQDTTITPHFAQSE